LTITSKLVDIAGLSFAVSQETDPVDAGGFSDPIQVVSAKSAKFSGGGDMKANSGLRIGMTQLKINTGDSTPGVRIEIGADFVGWVANGTIVDNSEVTFVSASIGAPIAVIDYGSVATRKARLVGRLSAIRPEFGSPTTLTLQYEISDDNITYTDPVTTNKIWASLSYVAGGDMMGGIPADSGIVSFVDPNTQSFRFIKILGIQTVAGGGTSKTGHMYQVTEDLGGVSTVTVRIRSSIGLDTADGSVIISDQVMNPNEILTFTTDLLLTGEGEFVTLQIVSLSNLDIPVTLSDITSIQEV